MFSFFQRYFIRCLCGCSVVMSISSCNSEDKQAVALQESVSKTLEIAARVLYNTNMQLYKAIVDKQRLPETKERANLWGNRMQRIDSLTRKILSDLKTLESLEEQKRDVQATAFFIKLVQYKKDLLLVDSLLANGVGDIILPDIDERGIYKFDTEIPFADLTGKDRILLFNKLKTDILNAENKAMYFCYEQVGTTGDNFDGYSAIIGQDSKMVQPGEKINIIAGVGAFSKKAMPVITMNGAIIDINENGTAEHAFRAPLKEGKYTIPVKISFTNTITGKNEVVEKTVKYTVVAPCDAIP